MVSMMVSMSMSVLSFSHLTSHQTFQPSAQSLPWLSHHSLLAEGPYVVGTLPDYLLRSRSAA